MKNIKSIVLTKVFVFIFLSISAQQKIKKDESNIKKSEYTIGADANKLIHISISKTDHISSTTLIKITNIYGEEVASYTINITGEEKENPTIVFDGNEVSRLSLEYFIEITINEKKYNEEIEFPH